MGNVEQRFPPCVSVVIPAFNAASCIREALDSVEAQTFRDYEVIVVNDGSTDNTQEIVQQYFANAMFPCAELISQSNKHVGGARNSGICRARGEFIAFLDADDIWYPEKLGRVMSHFERLPPVVGLVCHDESVTKDGEAFRTNRYGPSVEKMHDELLFGGNCLSPSAVVVRRGQIKKAGGFSEDPGFQAIEDYDLWLRLSKITRFAFLHDVLGEYRLVGDSIGSDPEYNLKNMLNVLDWHFANYFGHRQTTWRDNIRIRRRKSLAFRGAAQMAYRRGETRKAIRYGGACVKRDPFSWKNWAMLLLSASHSPLGGRSA